DKAAAVRGMFSDIAPTYDLLNSVLSLGLDRAWRREAAAAALAGLAGVAERAAVGPGLPDDTGAANVGATPGPLPRAPGSPRVLDVATGTGKLAFALKRRWPGCQVIGVDFAEPMLAVAR